VPSHGVSPAQARQWLNATRNTLIELKKIHPLMAAASELPITVLARSTRSRVLKRLVEKGYIARLGSTHGRYVACPESIDPPLKDDALLSDVLWPSRLAEVPQMQFGESPQAPAEEIPSELPEAALAPPPQIENMQRPPLGASPEAVQEWIFTMLHAQTENLIYIREQVDELLRKWS